MSLRRLLTLCEGLQTELLVRPESSKMQQQPANIFFRNLLHLFSVNCCSLWFSYLQILTCCDQNESVVISLFIQLRNQTIILLEYWRTHHMARFHSFPLGDWQWILINLNFQLNLYSWWLASFDPTTEVNLDSGLNSVSLTLAEETNKFTWLRGCLAERMLDGQSSNYFGCVYSSQWFWMFALIVIHVPSNFLSTKITNSAVPIVI